MPMSDSPETMDLLRSIDASLKLLVALAKQKAPRKAKESPMLEHRSKDPCPDCERRARCTAPCLHKDQYDAGQRWKADQEAQGKLTTAATAADKLEVPS
jgi:hypothetical protein